MTSSASTTTTAWEDVPVPHAFLCPITHEVMSDPVLLLGDGHSYERAAIQRWLSTANGAQVISPVTNAPLQTTAVLANHTLRKAIYEQFPDRVPKKVRHWPQDDAETVARATEPLIPASFADAFPLDAEAMLNRTRSRMAPEPLSSVVLAGAAAASPRQGSVYLGIHSQKFQYPEMGTATSWWFVKATFDEVVVVHPLEQQHLHQTKCHVTFTWYKRKQEFDPEIDASSSESMQGFAARLRGTVNQLFVCRTAGVFDPALGLLELRTVDECTVGNGFYSLLVSQSGIDGFFYLPSAFNRNKPSFGGRGVFQMFLLDSPASSVA